MKTIGLFYFCTKNAYSRMSAALEKQRVYFPAVRSVPAYLVTDGGRDTTPEALAGYFEDTFFCDPWTECEGRVHFNFSIMRNAAIAAASALGLDGLFFADSDTVIARLEIPEDLEFGNPYVYWQKHSGETVEQSALAIVSENSPFSNGNSWFYLSRNVYMRFRFNEKIIGYGYEDIDFWVRVEKEVKIESGVCGLVIHQWHSMEERAIDHARMARNEFIFQSTKKAIEAGHSITSQQISAYHATHPHWQQDIIINHDDQRILRMATYDGGKCVEQDGSYIVSWDNPDWGAERFIVLGDEYRYQDVAGYKSS